MGRDATFQLVKIPLAVSGPKVFVVLPLIALPQKPIRGAVHFSFQMSAAERQLLGILGLRAAPAVLTSMGTVAAAAARQAHWQYPQASSRHFGRCTGRPGRE